MVGAEAQLARAAVDERVGEAGEMPARHPRPRVLDDRRVQRHDVVALLEHRPPPLALDVVLEQHAVVAVVVAGADPAVDLAALEHEAAPLAQRDDLVHGDGVGGHRRDDASRGPAVGTRGESARSASYILAGDADLRISVQEGPHVRRQAALQRRPGRRLRGVRAPASRVFQAPAVHFKGSGFYNTDYGTRKRSREMKEHARSQSSSKIPRAPRTRRASSDSKSSSDSSDSKPKAKTEG